MKTTEKNCGGSNVAARSLFGKCQMKGWIMNEEKKCLRCGGTSLEPGNVQSTGKIYSCPENAKISSFLTTGVPVSSIMCFDCGHVELIVDPEKIKLIAKA